ncbi:MAG: hypothetical protein IPK88_14470 [Saprospiraceae bacterium]|uniref:Uncharacterized protein n=1 Tax=Candidatus Defluviibacterium haderslevense TaxID=2981993 RepID=A0A9D7SBZ3_9BACT|nr:hypothetical protein [Candidatus Defluviibacterium haderslevense]MBK9719822.1 hypothetical protein [Candidatus Defluviibacterium haderslevense]
MGYQTGLIRVTGAVGNIIFYKTQDGDLFRRKSGTAPEKIHNDPCFQKTREHINEFIKVIKSSKEIYYFLKKKNMPTSLPFNSIVKCLSQLKNEDTKNGHGNRTVDAGLRTHSGVILFNELFQDLNDQIRSKVLNYLIDPNTLKLDK